MSLLTGTLQNRAVVLVLWVIVVSLMVPFYMFTQRELAPGEDQSVVFGIVQSAPNATLDQTKLFAKGVLPMSSTRSPRRRTRSRSPRPEAASRAW